MTENEPAATNGAGAGEPSTRPVGPHRDGILEERVDDELLVYNPVTDSYFNLNRTATTVWDLATGEHTVDEIASMLATEFGVAVDEIIGDIRAIVTEFEEAGLLAPQPA